MRIRELTLKNWMNFKALDAVQFGDRVFVIGANAAGKSNLLDALRFLRDVARPAGFKPSGGGLQKAVLDRGGVTKVRCLNARKDPEVLIAVQVREDTNGDTWSYPVLLLTDLDDTHCPRALIGDWLGEKPHKRFLFRVCVREVESWLIGDIERLYAELGSRLKSAGCDSPEGIPNPKDELLRLARSARGAAKAGICPVHGSTATIGPNYNALLCEFVRKRWRVDVAARRCPSLQKTRVRLTQLARDVAQRI